MHSGPKVTIRTGPRRPRPRGRARGVNTSPPRTSVLPLAPRAGGAGMEIGRSPGHPGDEPRQPWMRAQRLHGAIRARQLRLGQRRMDLVVANLVKPHHRPALAPLQLGRQMVQALPDMRRDRTTAQRTLHILRPVACHAAAPVMRLTEAKNRGPACRNKTPLT